MIRQYRSLIIIGGILTALVLGLWGGFSYIIKKYTIKEIIVDGNIHYTNAEIIDFVMTGKYDNNSLLLSLRYKDKSIEGIPFIEKMDVKIISDDTVRIDVYEKALAGYVEFLGNYLYFDKDGIVVESADKATPGIPQVTGLAFDYAVMYERLPVEDEEIFSRILNITQLLDKYQVAADQLYFGAGGEITLYFGAVKAALGSEEYIDEKVMQLKDILPRLAGQSGTLRMEDYDEFKDYTILEPDP